MQETVALPVAASVSVDFMPDGRTSGWAGPMIKTDYPPWGAATRTEAADEALG